MLVLSRRIGEVIVIDGDIKVKVLGVQGNQVSLGFDAPDDVSINREEIEKRINEGKEQHNG